MLLEEGASSHLLDISGNTALTVLIDRLPNLALKALSQLQKTDVITMKEFYYIQFLEQFLPQKLETDSLDDTPERADMAAQVDTAAQVFTPLQIKTPATAKAYTNRNTPVLSGKISVSGKKSPNKVLLPTRSVRSALEMAVITRKFEVVTHPVMERLIYNKWIQYGRLSTLLDLLFNVVYGVLWTVVCMFTPATGKELLEPFDAQIWQKVMGIILGLMTLYDINKQIKSKYYKYLNA